MLAANLRFNLARYFRDIGGGRGAIVERTGAEHGMHGSKRPADYPETAVNAAIGQRGMPAQVQKGAAVRGVQLHATLRWRNTGAGGMTHTQPLVQGRARGATLTLPDA